MAERTHVLDLTRDELRQAVTALGLPGYRANQVRQWIFDKHVADFAEMTNLSKSDRAMLAERFIVETGRLASHQRSADGVHKVLIAWPDEATSEAVMIPAGDDRRTACLSTQVGCPVGCRFCASGVGGLERNLTAGEMVEQLLHLTRRSIPSDERLTNVVFMGIGEPLANYDAVLKAVRLINAPDGPNIGARKITISTIGLPAQIRRLAGEGLQVTLAISLHAPNQPLRTRLVPWADRFPLAEVIRAARYYFQRTGREVTLEYVCLAGVNLAPEHGDELARLAGTLRCNVNLICCNPVRELGFARPTAAEVRAFRDLLARSGVNVHIRPSRGLDIDAACGQLRQRHEGPPSPAPLSPNRKETTR